MQWVSTFAGPNLQIWTHRVAISGSPWQHYGNLEIPARLRCDQEITRSSFAGLELTHSSFAGPNLQIWTYRVAISRSPF